VRCQPQMAQASCEDLKAREIALQTLLRRVLQAVKSAWLQSVVRCVMQWQHEQVKFHWQQT
jgi:hypothetical protein